MFGFIVCLLTGHEPDRRKVKKVAEQEYYGYCRRCNARIRRLKRDKWVRTRNWPPALERGVGDQGAGTD